MSDHDLRELERRYRASGSPADRRAWARERLRGGERSPVELGGHYALDPVANRILHGRVPGDRTELAHSDADTFEVLHPGAGWARDRKRVWRFGVYCRGLDPAALRVLNRLFATDGKKVTTLSGFSIAGADPASFEVLDDGEWLGYARDAHRVYFFETGFKPRVLKVPRESFRVLEGPFATDGQRIYYEGYRTKGTLQGFSRLDADERLWRDATHVYRGRIRERSV